MDRITFSVNGNKCSEDSGKPLDSTGTGPEGVAKVGAFYVKAVDFKGLGTMRKLTVGHEVDSDVSLNDYVRTWLHLPGTKYMCKEGGCGSCVVAVTAPAPDGSLRTFSVNSCLVSVTSCQDWQVKTVEGLGSRRGYHPVQRALADHNGTQCGFCSPGWVMSMYSLLESNHYDLTQYEIENSFGSNTCRCTGYRPILDAFKGFAKDAPKPKAEIYDIEDLEVCKNHDKCNKTCKNWCFVAKKDSNPVVKKINLKDKRVWYRVNEIKDIFDIFNVEGTNSYMLVNGNTGRGAVPIFEFPRVLIDIQAVDHLKMHYIDQNLVLGAGIVLNDVMRIFKALSETKEEFSYLIKLYEHLDLVAHIPVRNIASIGGNLMVKHRLPTFSSDIFLLLETVGATLTIISATDTIEVTPEHFLTLDMTGRLITNIKLPPLSKHYEFVSFKIMPRSQNAHAAVNAGFLYHFDPYHHGTVLSARIVYGGLSAKFVHARLTEECLVTKNVFTNEVLQEALKVLEQELIVEEIPAELKPKYRKKAALGLFYKGLLNLKPQAAKPYYRSGGRDMRKTRPLSKGTEVYDTNPIIWPLNEPMPKVEALIQCAGEAKYVNDVPPETREVYCAFVTSDICVGEIESIDPSPAMELPGVLAFLTAKDIPGVNSFISSKVDFFSPEALLSDGKIHYYDQAIGIIVAETEKLANRAALLVNVKYKVDSRKPILTIRDARKRDPSRITTFLEVPARDRGNNVQKVIQDCENIFWQYHYTMETQTSLSRPSDDGIEVQSATQWLDLTHLTISEVLKLEQSRIDLSVTRLGGGYGCKIARATMVAAACSLVTHLLNRPCRFVMSMQANMRVVGKRFPATLDYEVGVNEEGEIQYMEYHLFDDNGYMPGEPQIYFATSAVKNCYESRRWQYKFYTVTTDTAVNAYARAPGAFEAIAMTEHVMERITWALDKDPVEIRLRNLNPSYPEVLEVVNTLLSDSEYQRRKQEVQQFNKMNRWKKRGLRIAMMSWPATNLIDYHVLLTVFHGDGTVAVKHGGIEIGQGVNTKVIQAVAYTLKISVDKIKVKGNDVISNPNNYIIGGSRATQAVCLGAIKCCQLLLDRLNPVREAMNNPTWEELVEAAYEQGINLQTSYQVHSNDQQPHRSAGAALVEVELDILTGEHDILRADIVEDVGTSINPELDIGQIEGAFVMGLGYWTHEHLIYDEKTGELLTDRSWYYHVPLAKDIPIDFRVQLRRNSYNEIGTLGARAVAEPPVCLAVSVAFALREAIMSSREDTGFPRTEWFNVDGPYTLEANVLHSEVKLEEFLFQ